MKKVIFIILGILLVGSIIFNIKNDEIAMNGIVIEVEDTELLVFSNDGLDYVALKNESKEKFKEGQEIKVYYDGIIATSYPGRIYGTKKIEIIKEKTDKEIPINILRDAKSSTNNVEAIVNEISNTGVNLTIIDKNEIPYEYANKYEITKEVKNENYTGKGYYTEATENSTSSYTGTGLEYIWEDVKKISDISSEETVENSTNNLSNMKDENYTVNVKKLDWLNLYGELEKGKYHLKLNGENCVTLNINFEILENDEIEISNLEIFS